MPKVIKNFKGKVCPAPWYPMESHLHHHPLLFGSLSPPSSTLSLSLPSPCSTQLLQRPRGTRKILGRLWSGGGCEDSLAATGHSAGFGSQPSTIFSATHQVTPKVTRSICCPPPDPQLHPKIAPRVLEVAQMGIKGHILKSCSK